MRFLRRMLYFVVTVIVVVVVLILWMAGGLQSTTSQQGPITQIQSAETSTGTATLDVIVWNIAWGYGWGSEGSGTAKPAEHFEHSIEKMGELLRSSGADVVLLQEADFGATRSHHVDQARRIAEIAGLRYVAYAESWSANWVPFPYWPIADQFGSMRSGGAILSRFPIVENKVELLAKPAENPFWYNLFYPFRFLQTVELRVGDKTVRVYNTHLEAFSSENRQAQARHISVGIADHDGPTIFGGDLNAVPPESELRKGYPDEPETNHESDPTVALMRSIDGLIDTIPPETFGPNQASLFTFPAHKPNRKLDHLFASGDFVIEAAGVLGEAGDVSDHLPVYAKLRLR